jgi:Resolvase, N terminal domain/Recombinase
MMIWVARAAVRAGRVSSLVAAICDGRVGTVLAIEVSRLARNGRDWHTLIEFCGLVGTVIVDEDGIYDPRHPNNRLLLGMKGRRIGIIAISSALAGGAEKRSAARCCVAAGYVKTRIEKDPDQRVHSALQLVFSKFAEFQSVRQRHVWLRDQNIELPAKSHDADGRCIVWKLPLYNTVHNILTNPVYAGAYAFGRTMSKVVVEDGRKYAVDRGGHRRIGMCCSKISTKATSRGISSRGTSA